VDRAGDVAAEEFRHRRQREVAVLGLGEDTEPGERAEKPISSDPLPEATDSSRVMGENPWKRAKNCGTGAIAPGLSLHHSSIRSGAV
jgi:hypothetical protein